MKYASIDFEFFAPEEPHPELVCCSIQIHNGPLEEYWLLDNTEERTRLVQDLYSMRQEYTFLAHAVVAEARCFLALGIDPLSFKWIDTMIEYRQITNHLKPFRYGKHYIDGKVKELIPFYLDPRPGQSKETPNHSYAEMCYKLLGKKIDTDHKNEMRDIIISRDKALIQKNKEDIQAYCSSDVLNLYPSLEVIVKALNTHLKGRMKRRIGECLYLRGKQMARTAIIEQKGYPIDYEKLKNFSKSVQSILNECIEDINCQFPDMGVFVRDKKSARYVKKEKPIREWIDTTEHAKTWEKTETGRYSLSLDAFAKFYNYKHDYPRNNFGAQMLRFLKLKQALNGMVEPVNRKKSKLFWDFVGSDKRVRPYLNPYGSQSGRFQPQATGFLFLKPAWMRALCMAEEGKVVIGIDYKSQEYLISALESKDKNMLKAYRSGDVYMDYAIGAGLAPKGATKATHGEQRNMAKPICITPLSLVRVKDKGYIEAEKVRKGDFVWSHNGWAEVLEGFELTSLDEKEVINFKGASMTEEHLCLTKTGNWSGVGILPQKDFTYASEQERREAEGSASWSDVWSMVRTIFRTIISKP